LVIAMASPESNP
jgi:hypothetical protein